MNILKSRDRHGFTIVELIVIIIVIAILASVTIVVYNGLQASAREKTLLSDVEAIESELSRYATKNTGVYGSSLNWYSPGAANANIKFVPTTGNIIDVVTSDTDYCIRAYNTKTKINSLLNSYKKGSSNSACSTLSASSVAQVDSPLPAIVSTTFDNGSLSIWSYSHMDATLTVSTERPRTGTRSAKQVHTDSWTISPEGYGSGDPGDGIRATITGLTVGKTYRYSGWAYMPTAASQSQVYWHAVSPSVPVVRGPAQPFNTWVEVSIVITATSTSQYIFLNSTNANTATSNGVTRTTYFDDIRVTEV